MRKKKGVKTIEKRVRNKGNCVLVVYDDEHALIGNVCQ